jgi:hypothetical protein
VAQAIYEYTVTGLREMIAGLRHAPLHLELIVLSMTPIFPQLPDQLDCSKSDDGKDQPS